MFSNNEIVIYVFFKRLRVMLVECIALSIVVSLLCAMDILPDGSNKLTIGLYCAAMLFFVMNFFHMRRYYKKLANKRKYYISNLSACIAFAIISFVANIVLPGQLFAGVFSVTKVFRGTMFNFTTYQSMLLFNCTMIICVLLATIGMKWVFIKKNERKAKMESMPPKLQVNPLENKSEKGK